MRAEIEHLTAPFKPYSDFNFVSFYAWDVDKSAAVALLNGNLVIRLPDYLTGEPVCSILGNNSVSASVITLLQSGAELHLVPEVTVKQLRHDSRFIIRQDRTAFDYIYLISELVSFAGPKNKRHRNQSRNFQRTYANHVKIATTKTLSPLMKKQLIAVAKDWFSTSPNRERGQKEEIAINRLFTKFNEFNLLLTVMEVDNIVEAFSINELLPDGYAICHFEKAHLIHPNIYAYLINQTAIELANRGARFLNWEQDLGIAGLRTSKMRYHPHRFLKKYSISLK